MTVTSRHMFDRHYIKMGFNFGIGLGLALLAMVLLGLALHVAIVIGVFGFNASGGMPPFAPILLCAFLVPLFVLFGIIGIYRIAGRSSGKTS